MQRYIMQGDISESGKEKKPANSQCRMGILAFDTKRWYHSEARFAVVIQRFSTIEEKETWYIQMFRFPCLELMIVRIKPIFRRLH